MGTIAALARNDLKSVRRDSLLVGVALAPWMMVIVMRLSVPPLTGWLAAERAFDLAPYYPLILSLFFLLNLPILFGMLTGFLVLEERDTDTLTALRVTPLSMREFALYRIGMASLLSMLFILVCVPLSGLLPLSAFSSLVFPALLAGLFAPAVALLLAAFASNKVEGLALGKAMGVLIVGPLAAYFIDSRWELLFGILPSYWPVKAFWLGVAGEGAAVFPYLMAGLVYHLALLAWLLSRFQRQLYQ